jgi:hypothetical protein
VLRVTVHHDLPVDDTVKSHWSLQVTSTYIGFFVPPLLISTDSLLTEISTSIGSSTESFLEQPAIEKSIKAVKRYKSFFIVFWLFGYVWLFFDICVLLN